MRAAHLLAPPLAVDALTSLLLGCGPADDAQIVDDELAHWEYLLNRLLRTSLFSLLIRKDGHRLMERLMVAPRLDIAQEGLVERQLRLRIQRVVHARQAARVLARVWRRLPAAISLAHSFTLRQRSHGGCRGLPRLQDLVAHQLPAHLLRV